jgi:hypothetical protein
MELEEQRTPSHLPKEGVYEARTEYAVADTTDTQHAPAQYRQYKQRWVGLVAFVSVRCRRGESSVHFISLVFSERSRRNELAVVCTNIYQQYDHLLLDLEVELTVHSCRGLQYHTYSGQLAVKFGEPCISSRLVHRSCICIPLWSPDFGE